MRVAVRADASKQIGSGHVMRCLALAGALRKWGAAVFFLSREDPGNLVDIIGRQGCAIHCLPDGVSGWEEDVHLTAEILKLKQGTDWLIVDQYSLDRRWEQAIRRHTRKVMVIDDLANRPHDCDLLLDQNFYDGMETRYAGLVPPACVQLLGPHYALLRSEFAETRKNLRSRDGRVGRILIFFGASDGTNETSKALEAVARLGSSIAIDVVIGINNPHREHIKKLATTIPLAVCHFPFADMAALMNGADLFLGAAGTTTWERCCLGLPSLIVTVADNQVQAARDLANHGVLHYIGDHKVVHCSDIVAALDRALGDPQLLQEYSQLSLKLVDGFGVQRSVDALWKGWLPS